MKSLDGSRPIIDNSGWEHIRTDIIDIHHYLSSGEKARNFYRRLKNMDRKALFSFSPLKVKLFYLLRQIGDKTRAVFLSEGQNDGNAPWMVSEYGGFGWYKMDADKPLLELIREYTKDILDAGIFSGYCYTQLYDVEAETNGLLTFQRVPKIDIREFKKITSLKPKQAVSPSTNVD
ncbi:hypothetical protein KA005_19485, partial [bacterium]|nr:hypothetical protein [bacterium]